MRSFENCVVLDGNQTTYINLAAAPTFENCVVLDGNQIFAPVSCRHLLFESYVVLLACVMLAFSGDVSVFAYAYTLFAGLGCAMNYVISPLIPSACFGTGDYAAIYSAAGVANMVGSAVGSYLLAVLANAFGYGKAYMVYAVFCVLVVIFDLAALRFAAKFRHEVQRR